MIDLMVDRHLKKTKKRARKRRRDDDDDGKTIDRERRR